jgi:hypothetical protein
MPSSPGPEIFLGDLVRVARRVAHDTGQVRRAAELLGLAGSVTAGPATVPTTGATAEAVGEGATAPDPAAIPSADSSAVAPDAWLDRPVRSVRTVIDAPAARPAEEFLAGMDVLPAPPLDEVDPPPPEPLFQPRWERALIAGALARPGAGGAVDLDEVVRRMAEQRPIASLPRRQRPSLRQGAHVLLDTGRAMLAFFDDRRRLAATLRRVVGTDRTTVSRFVGTPLRGAGTGAVEDWAPFTPTPGKPVVLLSDLGVAPSPDRAGVEEWLAFVARMGEVGCPVVAFAPYPAARVPAALTTAVNVVFWDGSTGPGHVAREARRRR